MPSTITTFYTFTGGTKARAEEVNHNFLMLRGSLLPIDPTTQAADTARTYGLGSSDHYWGNSYIEMINLGGTSSSWKITEETGSSTDLRFLLNGSEKFRIKSSAVPIAYDSASIVGQTSVVSVPTTTALWVNFPGFTITVNSNGRPVAINMQGGVTVTGTRPQGYLYSDGAVELRIYRNTTTSIIAIQELQGGSAVDRQRMPLSWIDLSAPAGSNTYNVQVSAWAGSATGVTITAKDVTIIGREL